MHVVIAALLITSWQTGEGAHPRLGPIRFAFIRDAVVTPVGNRSAYSLLYFSCERNTSTIAIELASAVARDDPGGLHPKVMPALLCEGRRPLPVRWQVNELGDALARGLPPSQVRACSSIRVVQELALPRGWERESVRVEMELRPSSPELASILHTCGADAAPAPALSPSPAPAPGWRHARTVASGNTNLRERPNLHSKVVAQLPPDIMVLAQPAEGDWWLVKSPGRARFEGYIRQDRLVFK